MDLKSDFTYKVPRATCQPLIFVYILFFECSKVRKVQFYGADHNNSACAPCAMPDAHKKATREVPSLLVHHFPKIRVITR